MKKILLTLAAIAAVLLPAAAQAPDHQHGGPSQSRIDWD